MDDINIKLTDLVASYPDIDNPNFTEDLFRKKELYDLKLEKEEKPTKDNKPLQHQKIISIFLSSYTMYDSLLLFHQMGTGKSIASIHTSKELLEQQFSIDKVYFFSNTDIIINNLQNEVKKYLNLDIKFDTTKQYNIRLKKRLNEKNYYFETILDLYKSNKLKKYENSLLVFDEIHDITKSEDTKDSAGITNEKKYNKIHKLLHTLKNKKVLLMSGTPMTDQANEISRVLNLILPTTKQLPTGESFDKRFLDDDKILDNTDKVDEFNNKTKGYISYLKSQKSIKTVFKGKGDKLSIGKLYKVKPHKFQEKKVIEVQSGGTGLGDKEIQAGLFVYPDGSIGKDGQKKYITAIKSKMSNKMTYKFNEEFNNNIQNIDNIKQYSIKYYTIIKSIIENKNDCHFVYCELVNGSGIRILKLLLNKFKIDSIFLHGEDLTSSQQIKLINRFNREENKNGKDIRVIIGTDKIKQGVSFNHIKHIHITTPHWNFSKTEQIIARGIRFGSHRFLDHPHSVNIYLYTLDVNKSIDITKYKTSDDKDKSIKSVEYAIKLNAIDCNLFYNRNFIDDTDDSRSCDYKKCNYVCNFFDNNTNPYDLDLDFSSFNEYYNHCFVLDEIKKMFVRYSVITLQQFINTFKEHYYVILNCLNIIISKQMPINNKYGISCYLKEYRDIFYLSYDLKSESNPFDFIYNELVITNNVPMIQMSLEQQIKDLYSNNNSVNYKEQIFNDNNYLGKKNDIKLSLIVNSIINKYYKNNDKYIDYLLKKYINLYNYDYEKKYFILNFNKQKYIIRNDSSFTQTTEEIRYITDQSEIETSAKEKNKKYVGIMSGFDFDKNVEKFLIKDITQKRTTGQYCLTILEKDRTKILQNLDIKIEQNSNATDQCKIIFDKLKKLNIIHYINFNENMYNNNKNKDNFKYKKTAKQSKTGCSKFKKTKDPKCNDQPGCQWVSGRGCIDKNQPTPQPTPQPIPQPIPQPKQISSEENSIKYFSRSKNNKWLSTFNKGLPFEYNGLVYPTVEHAFQAQKVTGTKQEEYQQLFTDPNSEPSDAKKMGGKTYFKEHNFKLRNDWDSNKLRLMEDITKEYYINNPDMLQKLKDTGNKQLIHSGFRIDSYWGMQKDGGQNHHGKILMKIREELNIPKQPKQREQPLQIKAVRQDETTKVKVTSCIEGAVQNQLDISKLVIQDKNLELFLEDQMKRKNIARPNNNYKVLLDGKEQIITEIKILNESGTYGLVYIISLDNNTKFLVKTSKKRSKVEEYALVDVIPKECNNILPIRKFGKGSVMMLYADTRFRDIEMNDFIIKQIVKIIGNSLLCLMRNNLYYFDLKISNILFRCLDGKTIEIFLADLGSMIADKDGDYPATFPPIEYMQRSDGKSYDAQLYKTQSDTQFDNDHKNGYINLQNMTPLDIEKAYVWLLSILYIELKSISSQNFSDLRYDLYNNMTFNGNYFYYTQTVNKFNQNKYLPPPIRYVFENSKENRYKLQEFLDML